MPPSSRPSLVVARPRRRRRPGRRVVGGARRRRPPGPAPGPRSPYRPPGRRPDRRPRSARRPTPVAGRATGASTTASPPAPPVRAAADGEVIFAGPVGGALHVTVRHADGLRTSYSFLAAIDVAGRRSGSGRAAVVGWPSEVFHFGVRAPDGTYLDPELLCRAGRASVPGGDDWCPGAEDGARRRSPSAARPAGDAGSRRRARARASAPTSIAGRSSAGCELAAALRRASSTRVHATRARSSGRRPVVARAGATARRPPTPVAAADGAAHRGRGRRASARPATAARDRRLDTAALGYDPGDVVRFSYAGGRVPPAHPDAGARSTRSADRRLTTSEYDAASTASSDLDESGRPARGPARRRRPRPRPACRSTSSPTPRAGWWPASRWTARRGARAPGRRSRTWSPLGSPAPGRRPRHGVEAVGHRPGRRRALERGAGAGSASSSIPALPGRRPAVGGVAVRRATCGDRPSPPGVRFTSIGGPGRPGRARRRAPPRPGRRARPSSPRSGAQRPRPTCPASPEATREIALALAGRPPTCRSLRDAADRPGGRPTARSAARTPLGAPRGAARSATAPLPRLPAAG